LPPHAFFLLLLPGLQHHVQLWRRAKSGAFLARAAAATSRFYFFFFRVDVLPVLIFSFFFLYGTAVTNALPTDRRQVVHVLCRYP